MNKSPYRIACFLVLALLFFGCGEDTTEENTEQIDPDTIATQSAALHMDKVNLFSTMIHLSIKDMMAPLLQNRRKDFSPDRNRMVCESPDDPLWEGYCWLDFAELSLGPQKPSYYGRFGYELDYPNGIYLQLHATEETDGNPKEIFLSLQVDWYNALHDLGSGRNRIYVHSPDHKYSWVKEPESGKLKDFCDFYTEHQPDPENIPEGSREFALAAFGEICEAVGLVDRESELISYAYIRDLWLIGSNYRGSMIMGQTPSTDEFREGVASMVVHWGYPSDESQDAESPRTRFLVKFIGNLEGIPYHAPADTSLCYVIDLRDSSLESLIAAVEQLQKGEIPDVDGIELPKEACPMQCIDDAECVEGEICDPENDICVDGCYDNSDCPFYKPTCCTEESCQNGSPIPGAGTCKTLNTSCGDDPSVCDIYPGTVCFEDECQFGCLNHDDCSSDVTGLHCTENNTDALGDCTLVCGGDEDCLPNQTCGSLNLCVAEATGCTTDSQYASLEYCDLESTTCKIGCRMDPEDNCLGALSCCPNRICQLNCR